MGRRCAFERAAPTRGQEKRKGNVEAQCQGKFLAINGEQRLGFWELPISLFPRLAHLSSREECIVETGPPHP